MSEIENNDAVSSDDMNLSAETVQPSENADKTLSTKERINESKKRWKELTGDIDISDTSDTSNGYPVCAIKRQGIKHINKAIKTGKANNCQDNYKILSDINKKYSIITVADGHGDKRHDLSEHGSRIACEQLCGIVSKILDEEEEITVIDFFTSFSFKKMLVDKWKEEVLKYHKAKFSNDDALNSNTIDRYGTTLLFAIAYRGFYVLGQLGDGGIIILDKNNKNYLHKLIPNKKIGSGTSSLCADSAESFLYIKTYLEKECNGIVLMTDGYFDIWESDKFLYESANYFIKTMVDCKYSKEEIEKKYYDKLNEAVGVATDDITIGVLTSLNNDNGKNSSDEHIKITSVNSEVFSISKSMPKSCKGIFSNKIKVALSESNITKERESFKSYNDIILPFNNTTIYDVNGYLFYPNEGYFTLEEYYDKIYKKQVEVDTYTSLTILTNILNFSKNYAKLLSEYKISLPLLLKTIEFSLDVSNIILYWVFIANLNELNSGNFIKNIAKYIVNFISLDKIFYYDEKPIKGQKEITKQDILHLESVKCYPETYIDSLFSLIAEENEIMLENLLDETNTLLQNCVRCSACGKSMIINNQKGTCICGKEFELFSTLTTEDNNIEKLIYANTIISIRNMKTEKNEKIIEVLKNDKDDIGLKNISDKEWLAETSNGETKPIGTDGIKKISDCISLIINGKKYLINNKEKGV